MLRWPAAPSRSTTPSRPARLKSDPVAATAGCGFLGGFAGAFPMARER